MVNVHINLQDSEGQPSCKTKENGDEAPIEAAPEAAAIVGTVDAAAPEVRPLAARCEDLLAQLDLSLQLARDLAASCDTFTETDKVTAGQTAEAAQQRLADLGAAVARLVPPPPKPSTVTSLYGKVYQLKKS